MRARLEGHSHSYQRTRISKNEASRLFQHHPRPKIVSIFAHYSVLYILRCWNTFPLSLRFYSEPPKTLPALTLFSVLRHRLHSRTMLYEVSKKVGVT